MKNRIYSLVLVLNLLALSSCRFGNKVVEADEVPNRVPADEFSRFEIDYSNRPQQFEFCFIRGTDQDPNQATEHCGNADLTYIPTALTSVFPDPIALARFNVSSGVVWALYNPTVQSESVFGVKFDTATAALTYSGAAKPQPLWPEDASNPDPSCIYNLVLNLNGKAEPDQKQLNLTFESYEAYAVNCTNTLNIIKGCVQGDASCAQEYQNFWRSYFDPWMNYAGMTSDDIPHLWASGYKVSFR